jgi:hypothetical protein
MLILEHGTPPSAQATVDVFGQSRTPSVNGFSQHHDGLVALLDQFLVMVVAVTEGTCGHSLSQAGGCVLGYEHVEQAVLVIDLAHAVHVRITIDVMLLVIVLPNVHLSPINLG